MVNDNLTEYQKTLLELFQTNGHAGVLQYFEKSEGLSAEAAQAKLDEVAIELFNVNATPEVVPAPEVETAPTTPEVAPDTAPEAPTEEASDVQTETVTVTFADGSQKEVEVGADGVVVSPAIPSPDALIPQEVVPEVAPSAEINSQPATTE